jgi:hypothetical protein
MNRIAPVNRVFFGLLGALLLVGRAAADGPIPISIGGSISTLGPGVSLTAAIQPKFLTAELDAAVIAYSHSISSDGATYSGTNHLVSVGLLGNVYPFGGAFHASAGVYYLDQHLPIDLHLQGGDYRINGQSYTSAELTSLTGRVEYSHGAPYVGIGWGNPTITPGWHLSGRLGVLYEGKPRVDFVGVTTLTGAQRDALYSNLDTQRRGLQNDLSSLPLYPVVGISVDYRF